ncbi:unnamed protein product [Musa hybrid cultivar]
MFKLCLSHVCFFSIFYHFISILVQSLNSSKCLFKSLTLYADMAGVRKAFRWIQDSRDQYTKERLEAINDEFKLYRCHNIQNCVHACPKGLNPAKQINSLKKPQLQ